MNVELYIPMFFIVFAGFSLSWTLLKLIAIATIQIRDKLLKTEE